MPEALVGCNSEDAILAVAILYGLGMLVWMVREARRLLSEPKE